MSDEQEIKNLLFRYAELLNTGDFDAVGALFRDGTVRIDGNPNAYSGAEAVAGMYRSTTNVPEDRPDSLLYTTNVQIEITGDRATCHSYFQALHQREGAIIVVVGGRYHDQLVKREGQWSFAERLMFVDLLGDLGEHLHGSIEDHLPGRG
jgi:ketosteroid isomerase-like protein